MRPAEDRYLELALEQVVGGRTAPRLENRILAAARIASVRRRRAPWLLGAAATVLVGLLLSWWATGPAPRPMPALTEMEARQLEVWAGALREEAGPGLTPDELKRRHERATAAQAELLAWVRERPEAFRAVQATLAPLAGPEVARVTRRRVLEILVQGPDPGSDPVVLATLEGEPALLDVEVLLRLGERGVTRAEKQLVAILDSADREADRLLAAVYLGLRGDPRGSALLRSSYARPPRPGKVRGLRTAVTAALHRCGDPELWGKHIMAAQIVLDLGMLPRARELTWELLYFAPVVAGERPVPIADLPAALDAFEAAHEGELAGAPEVRERLEALPR